MSIKKKAIGAILVGAMLVSTFFAGCGSLNPADTVATIGDRKISLGLANFMAKSTQASYDSYYRSYFGDTMWQTDMTGEGKTLEETTKESTLKNIKNLYLLVDHMADYNVTITDEETAAMEAAAKTFMEKNQSAVKSSFATRQEDVVEALRLATIGTKMEKAIKAEVDTNVTDEEALTKTFSYVAVPIVSTVDDSGSSVYFTEDQIAVQKENAGKILERAKAGEDFSTVAQEYSLSVSTYSYNKDESSMDEKVIAAANSLQDNQFASSVIETENQVYIIRMDSTFDKEATEKNKESIVSTRQSERYTAKLEEWGTDVAINVVESVWSKVNFNRQIKLVSDSSAATSESSSAATSQSSSAASN